MSRGRAKRMLNGCKQSVYFPEDLMLEIESEAARLDRSASWIVQRCIRSGGLDAVQELPSDCAEAAE